ncbi:sigma factor binding protein 1 [Carex littledalei]|uniref:Sigma factor binding protein 1 n=1 Tax=Carex littledalei TaxID=544730 RepID=A0A833QS94_9POAL|nr:sigma factor binding protein 1 [Carex littledalei]
MEKLNINLNSPKRTKTKKKPLKVVYISNPVKLTATAAQFRAVVQELTGRDSNIADTMVDQYYGDTSVTDTINTEDEPIRDLAPDQKVGVGVVVSSKGMADQTVDQLAEEAFTSPLLDNFSALCESQHIGNGFWEY